MMMNTRIVSFRFFGESRKRFAAIVDGRVAVELHTHPIRRCVAPYVAQLREGKVANMATIRADGTWAAFEAGTL
jgi:hypothetical protein